MYFCQLGPSTTDIDVIPLEPVKQDDIPENLEGSVRGILWNV